MFFNQEGTAVMGLWVAEKWGSTNIFTFKEPKQGSTPPWRAGIYIPEICKIDQKLDLIL